MTFKVGVLRVRKGVPGIGRKIALHLGANEVTCGYRPNIGAHEGAVIINYGRSQWPIWWRDDLTMINSPDGVVNSANKINGLQRMNENRVPTLRWTEDREEAREWLERGLCEHVYARLTLHGKQGRGIDIIDGSDVEFVPEAPLYTMGLPIKHEFRVHVGDRAVLDLVQKKRMGAKKLAQRGLDAPNEEIRNHKRGWVFAHKDLNITDEQRLVLNDLGVRATEACGLDYAGVDVIMDTNDDCYVCEVNSAPGMSSITTWKRYAEYFDGVIDALL